MVVATHGRSIWILDDLTPLAPGARPAARATRSGRGGAAARAVPAARDRAPADRRRLRRRGGAGERLARSGVAGHGQLRAHRRQHLSRAAGAAARRRVRHALSRRRPEPAQRRGRALPPARAAARRRDADVPRRARGASCAASPARRRLPAKAGRQPLPVEPPPARRAERARQGPGAARPAPTGRWWCRAATPCGSRSASAARRSRSTSCPTRASRPAPRDLEAQFVFLKAILARLVTVNATINDIDAMLEQVAISSAAPGTRRAAAACASSERAARGAARRSAAR